MCFSAGASFGASAILGVVGVLALRKTSSVSQMMFAGIPLIFCAQQFAEGMVWLSLMNPDYLAWQSGSIRAFLFFAQVLWPLWAPLAVLTLEREVGRKKILRGLAVAGIVVSVYLGYHLATDPVFAQTNSHHIHYTQAFPMATLWFAGLFYFLPTVVPSLISSIKNMWIMGLSILLSYLAALVCYPGYLTSVWCFFAAGISIEVLWIVGSPGRERARERVVRGNV